ncbi:hypothetical protein BS78_06G175400 [Paspalum vaginatum]|nr:hypothetical protein BS78_06G175400 [Paspalum vaginatum]
MRFAKEAHASGLLSLLGLGPGELRIVGHAWSQLDWVCVSECGGHGDGRADDGFDGPSFLPPDSRWLALAESELSAGCLRAARKHARPPRRPPGPVLPRMPPFVALGDAAPPVGARPAAPGRSPLMERLLDDFLQKSTSPARQPHRRGRPSSPECHPSPQLPPPRRGSMQTPHRAGCPSQIGSATNPPCCARCPRRFYLPISIANERMAVPVSMAREKN